MGRQCDHSGSWLLPSRIWNLNSMSIFSKTEELKTSTLCLLIGWQVPHI
ncbi:mCG147265 [Mus musculus]|nr:mCG147265 [Mus musculus]